PEKLSPTRAPLRRRIMPWRMNMAHLTICWASFSRRACPARPRRASSPAKSLLVSLIASLQDPDRLVGQVDFERRAVQQISAAWAEEQPHRALLEDRRFLVHRAGDQGIDLELLGRPVFGQRLAHLRAGVRELDGPRQLLRRQARWTIRFALHPGHFFAAD